MKERSSEDSSAKRYTITADHEENDFSYFSFNLLLSSLNIFPFFLSSANSSLALHHSGRISYGKHHTGVFIFWFRIISLVGIYRQSLFALAYRERYLDEFHLCASTPLLIVIRLNDLFMAYLLVYTLLFPLSFLKHFWGFIVEEHHGTSGWPVVFNHRMRKKNSNSKGKSPNLATISTKISNRKNRILSLYGQGNSNLICFHDPKEGLISKGITSFHFSFS